MSKRTAAVPENSSRAEKFCYPYGTLTSKFWMERGEAELLGRNNGSAKYIRINLLLTNQLLSSFVSRSSFNADF
jgi:hypothetical protein